MSAWTIEEVRAQLANVKAQLLAANQSFSISPSGGGTSRSVTRVDRGQLMKELAMWERKLAALEGRGTGGITVRQATFTGDVQCGPEGFERHR